MAGNSQDNRSNTYVDSSGVERYRGSNNRVDHSNNSSSSKSGSGGGSGSSKGSSSGSSGTRKKTTYTFKDGRVYTGYETNWEDAARKAGNTSGLSQAISYPDYVNDTEARRYLDEMGKRYGVTPGAATGAYENAVSKDYARKNGLIPDYDTPFNSYTAGTAQKEQYAQPEIPKYTGITRDEIDSYLGNADSAYKEKLDLLKNQQVKNYDRKRERVNADTENAQQEAYITSEINRNKSLRDMKEMGITGGLSESSIISQNASLENIRQKNEQARQEALADIDLNESNALTDYDARYLDYSASLQQAALNAYMQADAAQNAYNQWIAEYKASRTDAERSYAYQQAQLAAQQKEAEESKLNKAIEYAIELRDYETLEKLGYDTTYLKALGDADVRKAKLSGYATSSSKPDLTAGQAYEAYQKGMRTDKVLGALEYYYGSGNYGSDSDAKDVDVTNRTYKGKYGDLEYIVNGTGYSKNEIDKKLASGEFVMEGTGLNNGSYVIKKK